MMPSLDTQLPPVGLDMGLNSVHRFDRVRLDIQHAASNLPAILGQQFDQSRRTRHGRHRINIGKEAQGQGKYRVYGGLLLHVFRCRSRHGEVRYRDASKSIRDRCQQIRDAPRIGAGAIAEHRGYVQGLAELTQARPGQPLRARRQAGPTTQSYRLGAGGVNRPCPGRVAGG